VHNYAEALMVVEGQMNLDIAGELVAVGSGEAFIVPAGLPHAVAAGSHGTLLIVDA
jgi:mannose-6-phosphate isomerase-like protein (cupin superfamily)